MENYYFLAGENRRGPFSLDQLKTYPISQRTPIWKDSRSEWVPAVDLEELRSFVSTPVQPQAKQTAAGGETRMRNLIWAVFIVIVAGVIGINWITKRGPSATYSYSSTIPFVDQERVNPASFLQASGTYQPNFWRTRWTINGVVSNIAGHTNYKDVLIKVNFFSQTNTVIGTKEYVIYNYFPYGLKKGFTLEVDRPAVAATCGWQAVGATVY